MRLIVATVFLFFIVAGSALAQDTINQIDATGKKQGYWEKMQPNGKPLYKGQFKDDKPVGEWKRYHDNGVVKAQISYPENSDTAAVILYNNIGNKVAEGYYVGKEKAGHWNYFDKGKKVSEENYVDGTKNGLARTYYPTGELYVETDYVDGVENGIYRAFFKSGEVYFECQMKDGKRDGYCQIYHSNGEMETEAFYKAGVREDIWNYYDEDGKLSYALIYKKGLIQNQSVLDSVEQISYRKLDANRNKILDPEQFMQDPTQYMMQKGIH